MNNLNQIKKKFVSSSFVIICIKNQILLQLRDNKKDIWYPNMLGLFGGSLDQGEDAKHCAIREIFEEINIKIKKIKIFLEIKISNNNLFKNIYFIELDKLPPEFKLIEGKSFKLVKFNDISRYKKKIISIDFYAISLFLYFKYNMHIEMS